MQERRKEEVKNMGFKRRKAKANVQKLIVMLHSHFFKKVANR